MNPLFLILLAGGGYVLYQQSQGKSPFGGEECPSKINISGQAFARETSPGYENGGVVTEAFNDAGLVLTENRMIEDADIPKLKKLFSAKTSKGLADKAFRKLVPKGCSKSDAGTIVCLPILPDPSGESVLMLEMALPTLWLVIHSTIIGTFSNIMMALHAQGEKGMEEKAANCQKVLGKELEWWRKTMDVTGDIHEHISSKLVPLGDHEPMNLPTAEAQAFIGGLMDNAAAQIGEEFESDPMFGDGRPATSGSGPFPGKYGPMGEPNRYSWTPVVEEQFLISQRNADMVGPRLSPHQISEMRSDPRKTIGMVNSVYDDVFNAYNDPSIGQAIERRPPSSDTETKFAGFDRSNASPALIRLHAFGSIQKAIYGGGDIGDLPPPAMMNIMNYAKELFGENFERAKLDSDINLLNRLLFVTRGISSGMA